MKMTVRNRNENVSVLWKWLYVWEWLYALETRMFVYYENDCTYGNDCTHWKQEYTSTRSIIDYNTSNATTHQNKNYT